MNPEKAVLKLKNEFDENINSHVFLVETNNEIKALEKIKELIKYVIDEDNSTLCEQIDNESYIELLIIRPDGKEIKRNQIMELQDRIKTKPILSEYMFYIILQSETLNDISANKLLKTIEEPNQNVVGFLITNSRDQLLPTIKSRCEDISMIFENDDNLKINADLISLAGKFIKAIESQNHHDYYKLKLNESLLKENYNAVANLIKDYYNTACHVEKKEYLDLEIVEFIRTNNNIKILVDKTKYINSILNKLITNMNGDLLLEKIYFDINEVR